MAMMKNPNVFQVSVKVEFVDRDSTIAAFKKVIEELNARDWPFTAEAGGGDHSPYHFSYVGTRPLTQLERIQELEEKLDKLGMRWLKESVEARYGRNNTQG